MANNGSKSQENLVMLVRGWLKTSVGKPMADVEGRPFYPFFHDVSRIMGQVQAYSERHHLSVSQSLEILARGGIQATLRITPLFHVERHLFLIRASDNGERAEVIVYRTLDSKVKDRFLEYGFWQIPFFPGMKIWHEKHNGTDCHGAKAYYFVNPLQAAPFIRYRKNPEKLICKPLRPI